MAPANNNPVNSGGIPFRILVVDDDEDDRIILDEAFMEIGYAAEVKKFISGDALFHYLEKIDDLLMPSVIVLDYRIGKLTAIDVLKVLKQEKRYSSIPVVVQSSAMPAQIEKSLIKEGACSVVEKGNRMDAIIKFAVQLKQFSELK